MLAAHRIELGAAHAVGSALGTAIVVTHGLCDDRFDRVRKASSRSGAEAGERTAS